jgi:pimeloyl-ACP methyl ester carboxylesterase
MPRFSSDGLSLNYIDQGEGEPVVLVHGFASNLNVNWIGTKWADALLAAGFRVIAFDHRGHGESDKLYDPDRYTIGDMAKDTVALLDHLGIQKADLVGFSMGARVAAYVAITQPERVRSLTIGGMGSRLFGGASKPSEIAEALEAPTRDDVADPYARVFRVFAENTKSDLKALSAVIRSPRLPLTREMVGGLKIPVLVAVGTEDVVAGDPQELADAIPGAKVLPIPGKDHNKSVADVAFKDGVIAFLRQRP